jgi:hypothetical protein
MPVYRPSPLVEEELPSGSLVVGCRAGSSGLPDKADLKVRTTVTFEMHSSYQFTVDGGPSPAYVNFCTRLPSYVSVMKRSPFEFTARLCAP